MLTDDDLLGLVLETEGCRARSLLGLVVTQLLHQPLACPLYVLYMLVYAVLVYHDDVMIDDVRNNIPCYVINDRVT
jgi:hypothetical protein